MFDPRPTPTKYTLFPIIDRHPPSTSVPKQMSRDVTIEQSIRGISHRRSADQYAPSLASDMYIGYTPSDTSIPTERALLFQTPKFAPSRPLDMQSVGSDRFHNHTRTQLRNLP